MDINEINFNDWQYIEEASQPFPVPINKLCDANGQLLNKNYLHKYYYGQFLSHYLPYKLDKQEKSSFSTSVLKQDTSSYEEHDCHRLLVSNLGLVGYILVPKNLDSSSDTLDIKVVFRGTNPNSYSSVSRDLYESQGAGSFSFTQNKNLILKQIGDQINDRIKKLARNKQQIPVNITIAGHSLGGADAQNCLTAIMQTIAENYGYANNDHKNIPEEIASTFTKYKINQLKLFNYNSAGVSTETKNLSIDLAKFLYHKKESQHLREWLPEIETYNYLVNEDVVQQTGEGHVLDSVPKEYAKVDVLKLDNTNTCSINKKSQLMFSAGGFLAALNAPVSAATALTLGGLAAAAVVLPKIVSSFNAHTTPALLSQNSSQMINCISVNNSTSEGQEEAHKHLSNKSSLLNQVHNSTLAAMDCVTSIGLSGLKLVGIDNGYKFINKPAPQEEKINDDDELLKLIIQNIHELMDKCQKNSDSKKSSVYGMLTYFRNQITSYWSLSDKIWYTCEAFLSKEIHSTKNYLNSFASLKKELATIAQQYGNNSPIKPALDEFLSKSLDQITKDSKVNGVLGKL